MSCADSNEIFASTRRLLNECNGDHYVSADVLFEPAYVAVSAADIIMCGVLIVKHGF
jgi:hypothetical protein